MSVPTVTVTGKFTSPDGTAISGRIVFRLPVPLVDVDDNVIVQAGAVSVPLDSNGAFSHTLVPSDAAGVAPTPVAYHVTEPAGRAYYVLIPSVNTTVRLSELAPLDAPPSAVDTRASAAAISRAAAFTLAMGDTL